MLESYLRAIDDANHIHTDRIFGTPLSAYSSGVDHSIDVLESIDCRLECVFDTLSVAYIDLCECNYSRWELGAKLLYYIPGVALIENGQSLKKGTFQCSNARNLLRK